MSVVGVHPIDEESCPACGGLIVRVCWNEMARVTSQRNADLDEKEWALRWVLAELYQAREPDNSYFDYTQDGMLYRYTGEKYEAMPIDYVFPDRNQALEGSGMSKETIRIALKGDVEKGLALLGDAAGDDVALLRGEVARLTADLEQLRADVDKLITINRRSVVLGGLWADGLAGG